MRVEVKKLPHYPEEHVSDAMLLQPAKEGDAGADLYLAEDVTIAPGGRVLAKTGIAIAVPAGYEAQVRPRSGRALKEGLTVLNTPGTIDAGYRGEVGVILFNSNPSVDQQTIDRLIDSLDGHTEPGKVQDAFDATISQNTLRIARGERIAQIVFAKFERPSVEIVPDLSSTDRGAGGFGSTGTTAPV